MSEQEQQGQQQGQQQGPQDVQKQLVEKDFSEDIQAQARTHGLSLRKILEAVEKYGPAVREILGMILGRDDADAAAAPAAKGKRPEQAGKTEV